VTDVANIISRYKRAPESLLPVLKDIQKEQGYITPRDAAEVSEELDIPVSRIYGVATFYDHFKFIEPAKYEITVCDGTSCYALGAERIIHALEEELGVKRGGRTEDGLFSLDTGKCPGNCAQAPVMMVGDELHGDITPEEAVEIVRGLERPGEGSK